MGKCTTVDLTNTQAAALKDVTAGTQAAGKAVVADANANTGVSKVTELHIGTSGSETQVSASGSEINAACDVSINTAKMSASAAVAAAQTVAMQVSTHRVGNIIKTTMYIDLTGLKGTTTDNDIIGDTGASHFGQVTTAVNGVIYAGQVSCAEVPTTGPDDINLSAATVATGAYDADVTALTGYAAIMTAGAAHAVGTVKPFTALPAANSYLYLSSGEAGTAGTYDAGILIIEMWGLGT